MITTIDKLKIGDIFRLDGCEELYHYAGSIDGIYFYYHNLINKKSTNDRNRIVYLHQKNN